MTNREQGDVLLQDVIEEQPSAGVCFDPESYFGKWLASIEGSHFRELVEPSPGVLFDGDDLDFEGNISFDEDLPQKLETPGTLVVAEHGRLAGDIEVSTALIDGIFKGIIRATEEVILENHAVVIGDIHTPTLTIRGGAIIEGTCHFGVVREKAGPPVWSALKVGWAKVWRGRLFQ